MATARSVAALANMRGALIVLACQPVTNHERRRRHRRSRGRVGAGRGGVNVAFLGSNRRQQRVDAAGIRALEDALAPGHADVDATFRADEPRGTGS
jgi:hypothetical protein